MEWQNFSIFEKKNMPDSRLYSLKILGRINRNIQKKINWQSKTSLFLFSIIISLVGVHFVAGEDFSETQKYVLFILFFAICLWISEAIPPFAVGLLIIGYLVYALGHSSSDDVMQYVNTWSDSVIWLFLGGFFLAEGMRKTKLDEQLLRIVAPKLGNTSKYISLGLMLITAILSMLMSNTATTAMMIATITPITHQFGKNAGITKTLLIGIPSAAAIGGMGTIIGSAPNAIAVGALENVGITVTFLEWMLIGIPISLVLVSFFWRLLLKKYKLQDQKISLQFLYGKQINLQESEDEALDKTSKNIMLIILGLTLLLWLTSQWTGIPVAAVSAVPIVGLTMFGIIDADNVRHLPWDTLMLVAGGLSLGLAVQQYGLADYFISLINFEDINMYLLFLVFGLVTVILSNFMSNTATATIMIPISISLASLGILENPLILPLIISLSASCALLLPVSTPPNAIAFSTGMLDQSEFRFGGIIMGVVGPILTILWLLLLQLLFI